MECKFAKIEADRRRTRPSLKPAFTLVELLVVVAIIALLISIAVPSLTGARNVAKDAKTRAMIHSLTTALESFKNENAKEFRQTNGYPLSARRKDIHEGTLPHKNDETMYGAHWLPRYLLGKDQFGFVPRASVPPSLKDEPEKWYDADVFEDRRLDRVGPYISVEKVDLLPTNRLTGSQPSTVFEGLVVPVFVDAHERPILYYAANTHGTDPVMATGDPDSEGHKGIYIHEDNLGFTGRENSEGSNENGWLFMSKHPLRVVGESHADEIDDNTTSFAYYVTSKSALDQTSTQPDRAKRTVRAIKPDTYMLITAGRDGLYGTADDVNNFDPSK